MAQTTGLGHVGIYADDFMKQRDFYSRVIGLMIADENMERGMCFMSSDPVSEHHDRNAALMPWGVPSMASSRISLGNDSLVSARAVVGLGKASPAPLPTLRASASTSSERDDSGTR